MILTNMMKRPWKVNNFYFQELSMSQVKQEAGM